MSTRATIFYGETFHIYQEILTGDVCFDFDVAHRVNEKYGDPAFTMSQTKELYSALAKFLEF